MNPIKHNNDFVSIPLTVDQADQAVYAIEQCQQALIRALQLNVPATTRKEAYEVLSNYAGAIASLRTTLVEVGSPADPLNDHTDNNQMYHEMIVDQPWWKKAILLCTRDYTLISEGGDTLAFGKRLGNIFYEQEDT